MEASITYVVIARIPPAGLEAYERYEAAVLPLIAEHGGRLERRLRSDDAETEVHVVEFASAADAQTFREDPRRLAEQPVLRASGAVVELLTVTDAP